MSEIRSLAIEPDPDFTRIEKVLLRQGEPDRVPFYELFSNIQDDVLKRIGKYDTRLDEELPEDKTKSDLWIWQPSFELADRNVRHFYLPRKTYPCECWRALLLVLPNGPSILAA